MKKQLDQEAARQVTLAAMAVRREHYRPRHTPGPWRNENGTIEAGERCSPDRPGYFPARVAEVFGAYKAYDEDRIDSVAVANARLIAAAPELLAALLQLFAMNNCNYDRASEPYIEGMAQAKRVIDKANHG